MKNAGYAQGCARNVSLFPAQSGKKTVRLLVLDGDREHQLCFTFPHVAMAADEQVSPVGQAARTFATTRWTVVLQAGGPTSNSSAVALEQLCRTYWYPLYFFA